MRLLLLIAIVLYTRWTLQEVAAYQRAQRPNLQNLTAEEVQLAEVYWAYRVHDRVVRPPGERGPRPGRADLSYAFVTPLPERLAGIGYVGHAARLRLVLERVRRGAAIRVGALGGSITFGQGAGGPEFTYAAQFVEWLNAALPPDRPGRFTELPVPYWSGSGGSSGSSSSGSSSGSSDSSNGNSGASGSSSSSSSSSSTGEAGRSLLQESASAAAAAAAVADEPDTATPSRRFQFHPFRLRRLQQAAEVMRAGRVTVGRGRRSGGRRRAGSSDGQQQQMGGPAAASELAASTSAASTTTAAVGSDARAAGMTAAEEEAGTGAGGGGDGAAAAVAGATAAAAAGRVQVRRFRHHYMSGAVPGTQSGYMSSCLQHHLPRDADLVLLDYAVNDPPQPAPAFDDPHRRAFERLLRKVLTWPSRPAVVLVNMFAAGAARGRYYYNAERDFSELSSYYGVPAVSLKAALVPAYSAAAVAAAAAAAATAATAATAPGSSSSSSSAAIGGGGAGLLRGNANASSTSSGGAATAAAATTTTAVAAAQAAAWRLQLPAAAVGYAPGSSSATAARQTAALRNASLPVLLPAVFNGGKHHPGRGGHVVAAELLISLVLELLQANEHLTDLIDGPGAAWAAAGVSNDTSSSSSNSSSSSSSSSSSGGGRGGGSGPALRGLGPAAAAALEELSSRPLPPPLAAGNYEAANTTCYIEHELTAIVQQPAPGWNYTDEGRGKWGWVALEAGRELRLRLNTRLPGERAARGARDHIVVQVAYLQSYSGMGAARVSCQSGCVCEAAAAAAAGGLEVDAHDPRPVSVTSIADLRVSQHEACVLRITTLGPGRNAKRSKRPAGGGGSSLGQPGSKFKVMGVVVGEEPGASAGTVNWVRPESHESAQLMRLMANHTSNFSMISHF